MPAKNLYVDWLGDCTTSRHKVAVVRRIARIEHGNFRDQKFCRERIWELHIDADAGYRVYCALSGRHVGLLLYGGLDRPTANLMD